jgi:hypothetical protein
MMQEDVFKIATIVIAIVSVIIAIFAWRYPVSTETPSPPPPVEIEKENTPPSVNRFDNNPLHTISSGAVLKVKQDIYLPANEDVLYIQKGKFILSKEDVDGYEYLVILKLKEKSDKIRKIPSGKHLKITDSGRRGPEDREFRHAYIYLNIDNEDIYYLKCLGKDISEHITIGQFKNVMKGILDVDIPVPKEI